MLKSVLNNIQKLIWMFELFSEREDVKKNNIFCIKIFFY